MRTHTHTHATKKLRLAYSSRAARGSPESTLSERGRIHTQVHSCNYAQEKPSSPKRDVRQLRPARARGCKTKGSQFVDARAV